MRIACLGTLATFLFLSLPAFSTGDAQHLLEARFQKKVFFIRGFYRDSKLVYDAQGNVQGTPSAGPWTLALFRVDSCDARPGEFVLEGKRAVEVYDRGQTKFVTKLPPKAEDLQITVEMPADAVTDAALDVLAGRIFESGVSPDQLPEWWRPFFTKKEKMWTDIGGGNPIPGLELDGEPVFRPGQNGVSFPRAVITADPKYQGIARQAKYQGTAYIEAIVSKDGVPERMEVTQPLGMGLDDDAVETVRNWRFEPAELKGQPVAVVVVVEINFRLF